MVRFGQVGDLGRGGVEERFLAAEPQRDGGARNPQLADDYLSYRVDYKLNRDKYLRIIRDSVQYYIDTRNYVPGNLPIDKCVYSNPNHRVNIYSIKKLD